MILYENQYIRILLVAGKWTFSTGARQLWQVCGDENERNEIQNVKISFYSFGVFQKAWGENQLKSMSCAYTSAHIPYLTRQVNEQHSCI